MHDLTKKLSSFDLTMIIIGMVIGMGIFRTAATSASSAADPSVYFAVWIAGGFIALCGVLTYAEIGSRFPVMGGYFRIFSYAWHPSFAFSINCIILIANTSGMCGVSVIGAGYVSQAITGETPDDLTRGIIAGISILLMYFFNLFGLKLSSPTLNFLMIIKIAMILLLICALFFPGIYADNSDAWPATPTKPSEWIHTFGLSLIAVIFTYTGYQQVINFGSEIKDPARTIPRSSFLSLGIIVLLYLLVNLSYYKVVGFNEMKGQQEIAGVVILKFLGDSASRIFGILMFLAVLAYVNVSLMNAPRVMAAMSEDGSFPKPFQNKNSWGTFTVSLSLFTATSLLVLYFAETFDRILNFSMFLDCIGFAASAAGIFKLRRETQHLDSTGIYKIKYFPVAPLIFILCSVYLSVVIAVNNPITALTGLIVLAGFTMIYFTVKKFKKNN